jgi:glycopeptide antibiotics resistance protein
MSVASFLYKAKHNNVIVDSRIMLVLVNIVYYVLLFIAIYFPHEFTDQVAVG